MLYGKLVNISNEDVHFLLPNGKVQKVAPFGTYVIGRMLVGDILFYKKLKERRLILKKSLTPFEVRDEVVMPEEPKLHEIVEEVKEEEVVVESRGLLENLNEPMLDYSGMTKNQIMERLVEKGIPFKEYESKKDLFNKLIAK